MIGSTTRLFRWSRHLNLAQSRAERLFPARTQPMTHTAEIDLALRTTIRRVARATALRGSALGVVFGLGVAGAVALAFRLGFGLDWIHALWGLMALPVGGVIGAIACRTVLTEDEAAAWLDDRCSCGGLLMSRSAEWTTLPTEVRVPRVHWFDRSLGIRLGVLAAFVVGALAVPINQAPSPSSQRFNIDSVVDRLEEQVDLLEEVEAVETDDAQQIREELESLGESARSDDPGRTWEALDHARQQLEQLAEQAAENLADEVRNAGAAEEFASQLADMLEQSPEGLTPEQSEALQQALESLRENIDSESLQEAMQNLADALSQQGDQQRQQARQAQQQAAQQMAQNAGQCSGGACSGLGQLASGGMIDPDALQRALAQRAEAQAQLAELMGQYQAGQCSGGQLAALLDGIGSGGVSRGPGAARLSWNEMPSSIDGAEFEPLQVDSSAVDPSQSTLLSSGAMRPGDDMAGDSSSGGAIDPSPAAETGAANPVILPRHRDAVRRYFERNDQPQPSQEPGA